MTLHNCVSCVLYSPNVELPRGNKDTNKPYYYALTRILLCAWLPMPTAMCPYDNKVSALGSDKKIEFCFHFLSRAACTQCSKLCGIEMFSSALIFCAVFVVCPLVCTVCTYVLCICSLTQTLVPTCVRSCNFGNFGFALRR
jgi:hypothetical protein